MCTVSIVPHVNGFRLMCNRDEQRTRMAALAPTVRVAGAGLAAFPLDPVGGGTWVGVNNAGLAVALLNLAAGQRARCHRQSRGLVVRTLLAETSLAGARQTALALDAERFDPFRVIVVQGGCYGTITYDGRELIDAHVALTGPVVFTSSSLGDDFVYRPRRTLFARLVEATATPLHGQARFHRHQWRGRPEISVRMAHADAATVSRTVIDVTRRGHRLLYQSIGDSFEGPRECCFFP